MAKKNRKRSKDVKMAAANDNTEVQPLGMTVLHEEDGPVAVIDMPDPLPIPLPEKPAPKATPKPKTTPATSQARATAVGANYHVAAGRPAKQQVVYVFGKKGYSLSWVNRAIQLNVSPEELCQEFVKDPDGLKVRYAAATAKKVEAPKAS